MGKVLKTVATVASVIALAATGAGAIVGAGTLIAGASLGTIAAAAGATSVVAGSLAGSGRPNIPQSPTQLSRLQFRLDTQAPRRIVLGITAFPADGRYYEGSGEDERVIEYIIAVAAHKVREISELWIEDELAWSAAGGIAPQFIDYLGVEGYTEGKSTNTRAINGGARWGSDDRLTGCAYLYVRVNRLGATENEQSPFANGLPGRVTIVGEGMPMYDPRFDSTRGGSGSMRVDNQNTWGPSSGNPIIQSLNVLLGWRINGKLSVGAGLPAKYINFDSVITAANACDEDIVLSGGGTQPRYRTAGAFSTDDAPMNIVGALLAGCAGDLLDSDGQLSFLIKTNTLAVPAVTFDDHDILSAGRWDPMGGQTNLPNIISGNFTDPSDRSLYQPVPYPSVRLDSEDGIERTASIDFATVENAPQAERLAKQTLQRMQYPGLFSAEYNMKGMAAKVGSIVWQSYSPRGWLNKPFRVVSQKPSRSGRIALVLREEHEDIYAWEAEDSAAVQPAEPVRFDPKNTGPILLAREAAKVAEWDRIIDSTGTKPQNNATRNQSRGNYSASATYLPGDMVVWTVASGGDGAGYTRIGTGETTGIAPSNTSKWSLTVQRGQQGTQGPAGSNGADGAPATSAYLTNESATVWAYADGNVSSYEPATGQFKVFAGATDISASFSLSTVANPQGLTVNYSGRTFTVTGGLDPNEDTASLTIRATGSGAYAGKTFDKIFALAKTRGGYEIVTGLPSTNLFDGRQIWDQADGKLKIYKAGVGWRPQIDVDSALNGAKLQGGTIAATAFASGIEPVTVVSSTPGSFVTRTIFNTGDGKLYRWNGSAYVSTIPAGDVTGQLTNQQIESIAASKLSGQITTTQVGDEAISTPKLAAGSVSTAKIAAGAVEADKVAANAITTAKLAAGAVDADKIAANAIIAGKIAAGAVNADQIAARAVTIEKLLVSPSNLVQNSDFSKGFEGWFPVLGTAYQAVVTTNGGPSKNLLNFAHPGGGASEFSAIYASAVTHSDPNADSAGFEVREGEQYNISVYVSRSGAVTGNFQVRCYLLNVDGTTTSNINPINTSAAGFTPTWTTANLLTGTLTIPAGAYRCIPLIVVTGWTQGQVRCSKLRITRKADADLIVDGSILARNMAAESVTTDKLQAGAVTAAKLNVTALSAITADLGTVTAGEIIFNEGGFMRVQGLGFGSANQFFEWFGPSQSNLSNCTEANAVTYIKTDGSAYFGGNLSAGTISNAIQTTSLGADSVVLGPFVAQGRVASILAAATSGIVLATSGSTWVASSPPPDPYVNSRRSYRIEYVLERAETEAGPWTTIRTYSSTATSRTEAINAGSTGGTDPQPLRRYRHVLSIGVSATTNSALPAGDAVLRMRRTSFQDTTSNTPVGPNNGNNISIRYTEE